MIKVIIHRSIAGTSAMLTGIASSFGLVDGTVTSSESGTLVSAFSIVHENRGRSADSSFLVATVRMAGVAVGESQRLSLAITLSNGGQTNHDIGTRHLQGLFRWQYRL